MESPKTHGMTNAAPDGALYIASRRIEEGPTATVREPWSGAELGRVVLASEEHAEEAVAASVRAFDRLRARIELRTQDGALRRRPRDRGQEGHLRGPHRPRSRQAHHAGPRRGDPRAGHVPARGRGGHAHRRRGDAARHDRDVAWLHGDVGARARGAGHRTRAVQLPAQPRRPQGGTGPRVRLPCGAQASAAGASHRRSCSPSASARRGRRTTPCRWCRATSPSRRSSSATIASRHCRSPGAPRWAGT